MGKREERTLEEVIIENSPLEKSLLVLSEVLPENKDCSTCRFGKKSMGFRVGFDYWILCSNALCVAESKIDRGNGSFWVRKDEYSCHRE